MNAIYRTLILGKVDYNGTGRRINLVTIDVEIRADGELSIIGNVWNSRQAVISCGQNYETIAELFPKSAKVARIVEVWKRWHLNHMRAGTSAQEAYLRENPVVAGYPDTHYDAALRALNDAGLNPDNGYVYGSGWLSEELPAEIIEEVRGW